MRIKTFDPEHRPVVASWVSTRQEMLHLAPATDFPLTPAKVAAWKKPGGQVFQLTTVNDPGLLGYAELNPTQNDPTQYWLGHVVVRPDRRGLGLGERFVRGLVKIGFELLGARRISLIVFCDNPSAVRCYERVGFSSVRHEQHRFGGKGFGHKVLRMEIERPVG